MDSFLIFATQDPSLLTTIFLVAKAIVLVLVGVNMLIIVHEWGHFIVARMCGVKCEKFYIWFDIFGWKLFKFRWGDTEYGLGVLPLGGYVKMLGQEDNPGRLREELERAKALEEEKQGDVPADEEPSDTSRSTEETLDVQAAEAALYDPSSYLSKSVPQRMAIISAGVIMNVIFAVVFAVAAYGIGVFKVDSEIGLIAPGGAAWRADLHVGDRVIEVAGKPITQFDELREATMLGDLEDGVAIVVERPGVSEPVRVVVEPDREQRLPTIGIGGPDTTTLRDERPTVFGFPADQASTAFQAGDKIIAVNGQPVSSGYDYHRQEARHRDEPMALTVHRRSGVGKNATEEELTIDVETRPIRRFGMVMEAGPIGAIQANSPAAKAGLKPGEKILKIDGSPMGNPLMVEDRMRRLFEAASAEANSEPPSVALTLEGRAKPVQVELRFVDWYELPLYGNEPVSVPSLGITLEVTRRVAEVEEGSPAAAAGIKPGDVVEAVTPIPPDDATRKRFAIPDKLEQSGKRTDLTDEDAVVTWPAFFYSLQLLLPGTSVEFELKGGKTAKLDWDVDDQWNYPDRGIRFEAKETFVQAQSVGEALAFGVEETRNSLMMVFKFIGKVSSQQVSPRMMGGPWTIVKIAYYYANEGFSDLLLFLCMISANLAVINFLPIPVLDGGHMVFLAYEGIRGKPPSENVQVGLSYVGLFLLLGLMVWVFGLDLGFISR